MGVGGCVGPANGGSPQSHVPTSGGGTCVVGPGRPRGDHKGSRGSPLPGECVGMGWGVLKVCSDKVYTFGVRAEEFGAYIHMYLCFPSDLCFAHLFGDWR